MAPNTCTKTIKITVKPSVKVLILLPDGLHHALLPKNIFLKKGIIILNVIKI